MHLEPCTILRPIIDWSSQSNDGVEDMRSIPRPWSLVGDELDAHFGFPVAEKVEQANAYFQTKLHALLDAA